MAITAPLARLLTFFLLRVPAALGLAVFGLWSFGAVWFQMPGPPLFRQGFGGICALLFVAGALAILLGRAKRFLPPLAIAALALLGWWSTIRPSDTRHWQPDVAQKAAITIQGDEISVTNLRNFLWKDADTPGDTRWESRRYKLSGLTTMDLFLSVWDSPDIAHTIVSFGFDDGRHLAFSIEIRKELGESFDSLAGFFRRYELIVTVADEADVIKVRTNRRNERVSLYPIDVRPENARRLFLKYVDMVQQLDAAPAFYNTVTTNCTTGIFTMIRALSPGDFPLDWRVLVSGRVPEYLYERDFLDRSQPFAHLKAKADITEKAKAAEALADFSAAIRR